MAISLPLLFQNNAQLYVEAAVTNGENGMALDLKKLHELLFYAIDKASPEDLALDDATNTLGKIGGMLLTDLSITPDGKAGMWQRIDTYVRGYAGGARLDASAKSKCKTPLDMWEAQCKASNVNPIPAPDSVF